MKCAVKWNHGLYVGRKVRSHAGNGNMELRMESSHSRRELAMDQQASKWHPGQPHRAYVLNSKLYLAHLGEKAQGGLRGQETWAPGLALPPTEDMPWRTYSLC